MKRNKLAALIAGATLAATAAGCQSMNTNNANGNTVPANTGVVTNNNGNTNTSGVSTTNTSNMNGSMMNGNSNMSRGNYNANITREEYNRDKDRYSGEARQAGRTVGSGVNDGWLWTKTRAKLGTTDDLRDSTINVDVDNGVVTLTGTVASKAQSDRAKTVAGSVEGVKSVNNRLTVSGDGSTNVNNSNTRR
ncbi:MAG: BON domain-containing protein [Pyrinomonadaceae bacterium]